MNKKLNTLLITSLIAAICAILLYVYFYRTLSSNKEEVIESYAMSIQFKNKLSNLHSIEQNLKKTVLYGDRLSLLFLKQESVVDFIQTVEGLMGDVGVSGSVDSVVEQTYPELDILGKEKLNVVISANGEWASIVNLLGLFERLPYKSTLNSFSLVNKKTEENVADGKKVVSKREWQLKAEISVWVIKKPMNGDESALQNQNINAIQNDDEI